MIYVNEQSKTSPKALIQLFNIFNNIKHLHIWNKTIDIEKVGKIYFPKIQILTIQNLKQL